MLFSTCLGALKVDKIARILRLQLLTTVHMCIVNKHQTIPKVFFNIFNWSTSFKLQSATFLSVDYNKLANDWANPWYGEFILDATDLSVIVSFQTLGRLYTKGNYDLFILILSWGESLSSPFFWKFFKMIAGYNFDSHRGIFLTSVKRDSWYILEKIVKFINIIFFIHYNKHLFDLLRMALSIVCKFFKADKWSFIRIFECTVTEIWYCIELSTILDLDQTLFILIYGHRTSPIFKSHLCISLVNNVTGNMKSKSKRE